MNNNIKNNISPIKNRKINTIRTSIHEISFEKNNDKKIEQNVLNDNDIKDISTENELKKPIRRLSKKDSIKINVSKMFDNDLGKKIETDDLSNKISIKIFEDTRPLENNEYFYNKSNSQSPSGLAAIIPFFNEENTAIQQTLNSLHNAWYYLRAGCHKKWYNKELNVCLIQDGWYKADKSTKEYLKALFPKKFINSNNKLIGWWEYFKDFNLTENEQKNCEDKTYIFERVDHGEIFFNPQLNDKKSLKITLIIKIKNRRKHNSHEWFFGKNGFADSINPEYLFFTDAFAMYNNWCLYHLIKSLDKNKKIIASTGRQRLMSKKQQGSNESIFSIETLLRMVQLYDFESSNVIYNGAFSLGGMLPVIPGPCGMYRSINLIDDNIRNYYFNIVNQDPDKIGMILGNLRIAEDRVLTYASVVKSNIKNACIQFNSLAIFYFEAETDLDKLIFQRRRWINGSIAGYIYLLFYSFQDFKKWDTNIFKKIYIWILLWCQFLTYMLVAIAPSMVLRIFYHGLNYFLNFYNVELSFDLIIIGIVLWAIYLTHIFIHHSFTNFNYIIMYGLLILSILTTLLSTSSLLHYEFINRKNDFVETIISKDITLYLALYVLIGPFIVSLILSGKGHSFLFMIKSFIPYFLFLPMYIAWFGSYSYSRLWDLSWGNRPANELDTVSASKKIEIVNKFKKKNKIIICLILFINFALFLVPLRGQIIMMNIFFILAAYQLTLSIIYCITRIIYKLAFIIKKIQYKINKNKENNNV